MGVANLSNVSWSITFDGKLIFIGKSKTRTIDTLAVGESILVKDFVIGFGKTGITVNAGTATATADGIVVIIIVITNP